MRRARLTAARLTQIETCMQYLSSYRGSESDTAYCADLADHEMAEVGYSLYKIAEVNFMMMLSE
jgi:hypothetical protein